MALLGLKTGGERYLAECLRQTAAHFSYTSARLNRTFQTHGLMLQFVTLYLTACLSASLDLYKSATGNIEIC